MAQIKSYTDIENLLFYFCIPSRRLNAFAKGQEFIESIEVDTSANSLHWGSVHRTLSREEKVDINVYGSSVMIRLKTMTA